MLIRCKLISATLAGFKRQSLLYHSTTMPLNRTMKAPDNVQNVLTAFPELFQTHFVKLNTKLRSTNPRSSRLQQLFKESAPNQVPGLASEGQAAWEQKNMASPQLSQMVCSFEHLMMSSCLFVVLKVNLRKLSLHLCSFCGKNDG